MAEFSYIPEDVRQAVDGVRPGADIRLLAFSDLTPDGRFGEQFLALADDRLLVFSSDGESPEHLIGYIRKDHDLGTSGNAPSGDLTDNDYWAVDICPKGFAKDDYSAYPEHDDDRYWSRWFYEGDVVPVVKKGDDWYIFQAKIRTRTFVTI